LAQGMLLDVVRGPEKIARLQVERLYDSLAASTVIRQQPDTSIQVNDTVTTV